MQLFKLHFMRGVTPEVDFSSLYALDYLQAKINARATQRLGLGFFLNYSITLQDRVGTYMSVGGEEVNYDPFALVDLKLYYAPAAGIFKRQFPFQAFRKHQQRFGCGVLRSWQCDSARSMGKCGARIQIPLKIFSRPKKSRPLGGFFYFSFSLF